MNTYRDLPAVHQVLRLLRHIDGFPADLVTNEIRAVLAERRRDIAARQELPEGSVAEAVDQRLLQLKRPSLRRVINATGVVLHTNLGRAPLPALDPVSGYSNLEYDLDSGGRGKRDEHLTPLFKRLLGRRAIVVNNNAAAVYLALNEIAGGGEVIVSRGELIEIGDGFRIPEIMARSGAILREVGTTNKTRINDYEGAITEKTRLLLRVHPSNFHMSGFTARPAIEEFVELGRRRNIPVYEDLGSGCLLDLKGSGIHEPLVPHSLRVGVNLVSFSGDKLLGGPQTGIIAGDEELVARIRRNPMYRTFRVDKLIIQALQTTLTHLLREDWNRVPTLRMILSPIEVIRVRAERVRNRISGLPCQIRETVSLIGGGSTPDESLPTAVIELEVEIASEFSRLLRHAAVPVIARVERNRIVLDMRTIADDEEELLIEAVQWATRSLTRQEPDAQSGRVG